MSVTPSRLGLLLAVAVAAALIPSFAPAGADETPRCRGRLATIVGTERADELIGTEGDDVIVGLGGSDTIDGRAGDDVICAGRGRDTVRGGEGRDLILGQAGYDTLIGDDGRDRIFGMQGDDVLRGVGGIDRLNGGPGDDRLEGGGGNDQLFGGADDDVLRGGRGLDTLRPGSVEEDCGATDAFESCGPLVALARAVLTELEVVDQWGPTTPYDRREYDGGWLDADADCINTHHEILIRDSSTPVVMAPNGCQVASGTWRDGFTGDTFTDAADTTIDHFIPVPHTHSAGGWRWDGPTKKAWHNDLGFDESLQIAGDAINRDKGSKGPEEWKPPLQSAWCKYAIDWVAAKYRWGLRVREVELPALDTMFATCTGNERMRVWPPPIAEVQFAP